MTIKSWTIFEYVDKAGKNPFQTWLNGLKDIKGRVDRS